MTEQQAFVPPLTTSDEQRFTPLVWNNPSGTTKVYISKVGYKWSFNDKSGMTEKIQVSLAKLDNNGDIVGKKKTLNFPVDTTVEQLKELMNAVETVKTYSLVE